ncbi:hypothetical protein UFOVP235_29 [uncultured Caudovirales phage]|uniref:Uncharacterized protein n=1 Tax=uncultured Caudovirales phage TaxID=2100421 RepID=A0A6J7WQJ1_9CAUD|nr:hypothetical protein UFOVP235_29 [uncultured Caudovirales phage]
MYDSPKAPPPPKTPADFAPEIDKKRNELQTAYNTKANDYNTSVDAFNNTLKGLQDTYSGMHSGLNNLNITSVDDQGADYRNKLNALQQSLSGLQKPSSFNATSTFNFPEYAGATITLDTPQLHNLNSDLLNTLNSGYSTDNQFLSDLLGKRTKAESDYRNFYTGLGSSAGSTLDTANNLDLANYASSGFDRSGYNNLNSRLTNFTSDILGDYNFDGETNARNLIGQVKGKYDALDTQKVAEQKRISDYKTALQTYLNQSSNDFNTYTIKDADKLNTLEAALRSKGQEASQFTSPLSFDLSGLTNQYNSLDSNISNKLAERQRELDRIATTQNSYGSQAQTLAGLANSADIYSQNNLTDITNQINNLSRNVGGFSSLLDYNFGDANKSITAAQQQIAALNASRAQALKDLQTRGDKFSAGLADIPLYNESDFNSRLQQENDVLSQLGQFSGGDVNPYRTAVASDQQAIKDKLQQLYDYRTGIESQAKGLQKKFNDQSFYDLDSVDAARKGDYKSLMDQISLYNATQANDESSGIKSRLDSEYARLTQEAATKQALAAQEAKSASSAITSGQIYTVNGIPLTAEEYAALMQNKANQDKTGNSSNSAFLQALGLTG